MLVKALDAFADGMSFFGANLTYTLIVSSVDWMHRDASRAQLPILLGAGLKSLRREDLLMNLLENP